MGLRGLALFVLLVEVAVAAHAPNGLDTSMCDPKRTAVHDLPNLPSSFSMRVEANILNKNMTTTLREFYNADANIAAVRQIQDGQEEYYFYYYDTNQLLEVANDGQGGRFCQGSDLSQSDNQNMFGLQKVNSTTDRIYSVYGALHLGGNVKSDYAGQDTVRGIPCVMYDSCQYWDDMKATSYVIWYFSDESQWRSISGYSAPVMCHVWGIRWVNESYSYNYEHLYEFFDFEANITAGDVNFDVPTNTFCYSETNRKPLPSMPTAYSFNAELLDLNLKTISFVKELYDNSTNILRYDTRDPPQTNSAFGTRYMSQINDYNTGVAYVLDVLQGTCTASVIAEHAFDNINTDPSHVRLRNPNEFLDLNHDYAYQGVRSARNIDCDAWSAVRYDYPNPQSQTNPATVWTWYFATADWMKQMGYRDNLSMPVMLEIFSDDATSPVHKAMSIYEYNAEDPDIMSFDISTCYDPTQSQNIAFLVPGSYRSVVAGDEKLFKYFILTSIVAFTNVSPLRVSRVDLQEASDSVLVTFDLLDKAPLPGDVKNPPQEVSLADAVAKLVNGINNGQLTVLMQSPGVNDIRRLTAKPAPPQYQFRVLSRAKRFLSSPANSRFSGGSMGGMAVGMLALGALLGVGVMFGLRKYRGGTFEGLGGRHGMKKFDNEPKPEPEPEVSEA